MNDGTAGDVIKYLDLLVDKGRATSGAISPLKVSLSKVMEGVEGDDWQNTNIQNLDVQDYMDRFANKTMGTYTSASLVVYKNRVIRALDWYKKFLAEPGWMPQIKARTTSEPAKLTGATRAPESVTSVSRQLPTQQVHHVINNALTYPFPLDSGEVAQISLPREISKYDANRLSVFIKSLVIETEDE